MLYSHLYSDLHGRKRERSFSRKIFVLILTILYVEFDSILDVFYYLFISGALTVAALKRRAGGDEAIGILFYDHGKSTVFHKSSIP
jgi:hypothetical protein